MSEERVPHGEDPVALPLHSTTFHFARWSEHPSQHISFTRAYPVCLNHTGCKRQGDSGSSSRFNWSWADIRIKQA